VTVLSASGTTQWNGAGEFDAYNLTIGDTTTTFTIDNETNDLVLDIGNDFTVSTDATFQASSTASFAVAGSWVNNGTFTDNLGTVTFDDTSGDGAETLSGRLNNAVTSSAFNKVDFNGSGGAWTIQDAMKVSADATDTFLVQQGTVTLGNGDNDDLEVNGKMVVGSSSSTATFQTMDSLAQGSEIIIDVNNYASPVSCSNCIINVGTGTDGDPQGTFTLNENAVLRFNSNASVESGLEVLASGKLNITGDQDDTGTVTSISETVITASAESWGANDHQNKHVRITNTSSLAFGTIHDISSNGTTTLTIPDNFSASDTTGSYSASTRVFTAGTSMISNDNDAIGQYLYNSSQGTRSRIVDSTEAGSADTITIANTPDTFLHSGGDTVTITYGILVDDTFEILDYSTVTGAAGTACNADDSSTFHGYIYGQDQSETLIQYADVCDLGAVTANKQGLSFNSVDASNSNEGVKIDKSRIHGGFDGIRFSSSVNNNTTNSTGLTDNSIYSNPTSIGVDLNSSNNNVLTSNVVYNNPFGIYLTSSNNNVLTSNVVYISRGGDGIYLTSSSNNVITSSTSFSNSGYSMALATNCDNNRMTSNTGYGNSAGIQIYFSSDNTLTSNAFYSNTTGVYFFDSPGTVAVGDDYGVSGKNSTADVEFEDLSSGSTVRMYGVDMASTTEITANDVAYSGAFLISEDHDPAGQSGLTKVWGEYVVPGDVTETVSNDEGTQKFNYADGLWDDSATAHGYSGTVLYHLPLRRSCFSLYLYSPWNLYRSCHWGAVYHHRRSNKP
jgi:parallel beta-helix repeat protein